MLALNWGDMGKWFAAYTTALKFRRQLKPKLDQGDKSAQTFNREQVVTLGILVNNAVFSNP